MGIMCKLLDEAFGLCVATSYGQFINLDLFLTFKKLLLSKSAVKFRVF